MLVRELNLLLLLILLAVSYRQNQLAPLPQLLFLPMYLPVGLRKQVQLLFPRSLMSMLLK